jgi:hypothetical protein
VAARHHCAVPPCVVTIVSQLEQCVVLRSLAASSLSPWQVVSAVDADGGLVNGSRCLLARLAFTWHGEGVVLPQPYQ